MEWYENSHCASLGLLDYDPDIQPQNLRKGIILEIDKKTETLLVDVQERFEWDSENNKWKFEECKGKTIIGKNHEVTAYVKVPPDNEVEKVCGRVWQFDGWNEAGNCDIQAIWQEYRNGKKQVLKNQFGKVQIDIDKFTSFEEAQKYCKEHDKKKYLYQLSSKTMSPFK